MAKISKKKIIWTIAGVLIISGIVYSLFFSSKGIEQEFVVAERGDLIQEVSVTGKVTPAQSVDLAFEKSGKVVWVNGQIGDKVYAGQTIVQIANGDVVAQLNQAEANVKTQQAKLDELKAGTRPEEIQFYEIKIENAKTSLEDAKRNLIDKILDAYTKSDDAVRNQADKLFSNPRSANPDFNINTETQLKININAGRLSAENTLVSWIISLGNLSTASDLGKYTNEAKNNLNLFNLFLENVSLAVNVLTANSTLTQTTIDGYKTAISTARTNVNTAIGNLSTADEKFRTAESTLSLAEQELILKKAGSTKEQITAQEAQVENALASVKNYQSAVAKTFIRSPISGTITKQEAKVGEIIGASVSIVSLISESEFEIETNITETDIIKIKIGDYAKVTLDAYGDDVIFSASVAKIDPAETIIEGVSTYKTTLVFNNKDERIKSGMTANTDILTAKRNDVVYIPQRAVIDGNGGKIVRILEGENVIERKVETGLRSSDGNIEIISGINEGDKVIVFLKK